MTAPDPTTGTLVLLRHGESTYNAADRFTGLIDVELSVAGVREAQAAGEILSDAVAHHPGLAPARILTSPMLRAAATAEVIAAALDQAPGRNGAPAGPPPVELRWQLSERHYGAFTGQLRQTVLAEHGEAAYWEYRRSLTHRPPPLTPADPAWELVAATIDRLPDEAHAPPPLGLRRDTESLADVVTRLEPLWAEIRGTLGAGESLVVVGHGNSLRALSLLIDGLSPEEVQGLNIPTGHPLMYRFVRADAREGAGLHPVERGGVYLDEDGAEDALEDLVLRGGT